VAREILVVIHCDMCGKVIENEDDVQELDVRIGSTDYKLELCEECDDYSGITLMNVIDKGHSQSTRKQKASKGATQELICPVCKRTDFESKQGLSMHKTRAGHWTKDDPRPTAADTKKAYRERMKDSGDVKGYLVRN
jgi:hypothetical protein